MEQLIETPLFQFITTGGKTTFQALEKNNLFENEAVLQLFDGARISREYTVPFNKVLEAKGLLLEGEEQ